MRYRIDQDQLWEFLARQARLVERLPVEATQAAADGFTCTPRPSHTSSRSFASTKGARVSSPELKLRRDKAQISYLSYPDFDVAAHPALAEVTTADWSAPVSVDI